MAEKTLGALEVEIKASLDQFATQMQAAVGHLGKLSSQIEKTNSVAKKSSSVWDQVGKRWDVVKGNIIALNQSLDLLQRGISIVSNAAVKMGEAMDRGQQFHELSSAFKNLYQDSILSVDGLGQLQKATGGLVSKMSLLESANNAAQKGLSPEIFLEVAKGADQLGDSLGVAAKTITSEFTEALALGRTKGLAKFVGTLTEVEAVSKKLAASLGQDKLSDSQQIIVTRAVAMDKFREKLAAAGVAADTAGDAWQRLVASFDDAKTDIATALIQNQELGKAFDELRKTISEIDPAKVVHAVDEMIGRFKDFYGWLVKVDEALMKVMDPTGFSEQTNLKRFREQLEGVAKDPKGILKFIEDTGKAITNAQFGIQQQQGAKPLGALGDFLPFVNDKQITAIQDYTGLMQAAGTVSGEAAEMLASVAGAQEKSAGATEKAAGATDKAVASAKDYKGLLGQLKGVADGSEGAAGSIKKQAEGIRDLQAKLADATRAAQTSGLDQAFQSALSRGDFAGIDKLRSAFEQNTREGVTDGLRSAIEKAGADNSLAKSLVKQIQDAEIKRKQVEAASTIKDAAADFAAQNLANELQIRLTEAFDKGALGAVPAITSGMFTATYDGAIRGLGDAFKNATPEAQEAAKQYATAVAAAQVRAVNTQVQQALKQAHLNAVDFWRDAFENAITGETFNLEDMAKRLGVGMASEFMASLTQGLFGGESAKSLEDLGGKIAGGLFKSLFGGGTQSIAPGTTGIGPVASGNAYGSALSNVGGLSGGLGGLSTTGAGSFGAMFAGAIPAIAAAVAVATAQGTLDSFKVGTKEGVAEGLKSGFDDFGDAALALASGGLSIPLRAGAAAIGGWTGGADFDPAHQTRNAIEGWLEDSLKDSGTRFFDQQKGGNLEQFSGDFKFGDAEKQFEEGGWAEQMQSFGAESASVFDSLGKALAELLGTTEDIGAQIGFVLQENLSGNIDNARLLVSALGLEFEQVEQAMLDAAKHGDISWKEFQDTLRGVAPAFGEGLIAIGDMKGAFDQFVASGNIGQATLDGLRNIIIEAGEAGVKTFDELRDSLIASGVSAEQVDILFASFEAHGVKLKESADGASASLDQLKDVGDVALGGIAGTAEDLGFAFADIPKNVKETNTQLKDTNALLEQAQSTIAEIPKDIQIKFTVTGLEDLPDESSGGSSGGGSTPAAKTTTTGGTTVGTGSKKLLAVGKSNTGISGSVSDLDVPSGGKDEKEDKKSSSKKKSSGKGKAEAKGVDDFLKTVKPLLNQFQDVFTGEVDVTIGMAKTISDLFSQRATLGEKAFNDSINSLAKANAAEDKQREFTRQLNAAIDAAQKTAADIADAAKKTKAALTPVIGEFNAEALVSPEVLAAMAGDARVAFEIIGKGLASTLGIADELLAETSKKIGATLAVDLGGNLDLLRHAVGNLKLDFEEMTDVLVQPARDGKMAWADFAKEIKQLRDAFSPGLAAVGHITGAFNNLIQSGGTGFEAIQSVRDIAVEAMELGAKTYEDAQRLLVDSGAFNPDDITKFFDSVRAVMGDITGQDLIDTLKDNKGAFKDQAAFLQVLGAVQDANLGSLTPESFGTLKDSLTGKVDAKDIDTLRIIIQQLSTSLEDLANASDAVAGEIVGNAANTGVSFFASGGAFSNGNLMNVPTAFGYGNGQMGIGGEMGTEALMPLVRRGGKLNVMATVPGGGGSVGSTYHFNIDARNAAPGSEHAFRRVMMEVKDKIVAEAVQATATQRRRGGSYSSAFGR